TANVSDDRYVRSVEAFWREDGSETFTSAKMTSVDGEYTVSLPTQNALTTIEYYLIASDGVNEAKTETFSVEVDQTDVQGPVITSVTPKNKANLGETTTTNITVNFSDDSAVNFAELSVNGEVIESSLSETTVEAVDVTIAEENTATVTLRDEHGNETTYEWTFKASISTLEHYYGQIHAHSNLSDGYGTPEEAYTYANEVANLDFFALTDHSNWFDNDTQASLADGSASSEWQTGLAEADKANVPGEYTAIYGYEMTWSGSTGGYGHINTFNTPGFETRTNKAMNLPTYYDAIAEYGDSVSQLNHPGKTFGDFVDFGYYTAAADAVVNLVEVGNGEGPVHGTGYFPSYDYYTRALDKGWHVAPTNNQDNHKGNWGTSNTARTVVIAEENTRDGLYEAMQANRVYATEDSNLKIDYTLNGEVMGTQLAQTDTVNIKVAVTDPDGEAIGKVSIITDGGYVAATKYFDSSTATWEFELPAQFSYYYVRVDQPDKDVAVTAPVWVGEKENVGLSSVSVDNEKVIKGDTFEAKTTITNNSELPLTDLTVEWFVGSVEGEPVASTLVPVVEAGKMVDVKAEFLAEAVGTMTVYARVNLNGKYHTASKQISVVNVSDVTQVLVDGSKYNQYVTGNYAGKIENFKDLMSKRDVLVKVTQPATEITAEVLENMSVLIITDPEGTGGSSYEKANYSAEEIAVITQYVENGGNIIVTTRADYKDASGEYSNSAQLNPLLEAIGTSLRVNDDQVQDMENYNNQTYRLSFNNFVEDPFGLTNGLSDKDNYTFYSGASVIVDTEATKAETTATCLVKGHATTESMNMDSADDHVAVEKGNVCALAAQELDNGAKVVVAGTTFFSDYEIADDVTANQLLTNNIMRWVAPEKEAPLISIANFRVHPEGIRFSVEGYVTSQSSAVEPKNGFFDTIHIQDETGGLTVFGVSDREFKVGQKVRVTGYSDVYDGDIEISILDETKDIEILDATLNPVEPTVLSTAETMNYKHNGGLLVTTVGTVTRIEGQSLYVNDGTGEARIFLDGYIGDGIDESSKGKWDETIQVGSLVQATGIASHDVEGARIRIRNTQEIVNLTAEVDKVPAETLAAALGEYLKANGRFELMDEIAKIAELVEQLSAATTQTEVDAIVTELETIKDAVITAYETYSGVVDELTQAMLAALKQLPDYVAHPQFADHEVVVALVALVEQVQAEASIETTTTQLATYATDVAILINSLPELTDGEPQPEVDQPAAEGFGPEGDVTPELEATPEDTTTPDAQVDQPAVEGFGPEGDVTPEVDAGATTTGTPSTDETQPEQLPTTGQAVVELMAIGATLAAGGVTVYRRRKND
ncbi:MAG: CehA/McbA family metallohydrolase, partial [Culicoidibacterales bacterium]